MQVQKPQHALTTVAGKLSNFVDRMFPGSSIIRFCTENKSEISDQPKLSGRPEYDINVKN